MNHTLNTGAQLNYPYLNMKVLLITENHYNNNMKHNKPQYIKIDCFGNTTYFGDKKMTRCHLEDGPAVERADDSKSWYLNDEELSEAKFNARTKPTPSCEGKVVEVDGVKYKLTKV